MEEFACENCGATFECYPSQRRKYCGPKCRLACQSAKPKTGRMKPCVECSTEFWVVPARETTAKYCSRACKDKAKLLVGHECVECGAKFEAWPSERRRYCSRVCARKHKTFRKGGQCETCGQPTDPRKNQHRFCSLACAHEGSRNGQEIPCAQCGTPTYRTPGNRSKTTYCSIDCKNEALKIDGPGSRYKAGGYVYVYFPAHPDSSARGVIAEHRLVAEEKIGRRLKKGEHVHHVNGVKDDNRPENLEVIKAGDHARVTVKEAVAKRRAAEAELAAYRERFGPLDQQTT